MDDLLSIIVIGAELFGRSTFGIWDMGYTPKIHYNSCS